MTRPSPLLFLLLVGSASCGGAAEVPAPRNLVFLCVDTLRADELGVYGGERGLSPRVDALAESGIVFERARSHASWTLPSFAAVLTSLYTSTHGCWDFESRLPESFQTLPELFEGAGFDTHGVASHVFFREEYGLTQGFGSFDAELGHKREETGWVPLTSPRVSAQAEVWLDARAAAGEERPFLLWLHYFDPHLPYVDHEAMGGGAQTPDERERYRAEIAYTDGFVGDVLDALERNGFAEETAVVFLSDHGEAFHDHPGVRRHSRSLYVEELRVPLVLRVPGLAPRRVAEPVRTVDLLPTLLELFGIAPPADQPMEGVSLVAALRGEAFEARALLAEIGLHDDARHARSIVDGRWKLIERLDGTPELYDVEADPLERNDLAGEQQAVVGELTARMDALQRRAEERGQAFERGGKVDVSDEDRERLRDLGYVGDE
jgi:arylsulfatase A-like enzyme